MIQMLGEILLHLGLVAFLWKRLLRYLRYFQQEEYKAERFLNWLCQNKAFDMKGSFVGLLTLLSLFCTSCESLISIAQGFLFAHLAYHEVDPRHDGKKKLVLTQRAQSIYIVAFILGLVSLVLIDRSYRLIGLLIYLQLPPFLLIAAVFLLIPRERAIQSKLRKEAHEKFLTINPFSIGITGSFGKTSVKNLLGEILQQALGSTFWPKAGVNTEMGITREIREKMNSYDKYAVIEMGAYHRGSITKLCRLTPISAGLVTAVHLMHLERFGSEEDIYQAKSELPQHVPQDGILVVNGDNPGSRRMATEFPKKKTIIYGMDKSNGRLDVVLSDVVIRSDGTSFAIEWQGKVYQGFTKMHGQGALLNILGCFAMACVLGANPEVVLAVIRNIEPVSNRLEVKSYGRFIQINDAYNSNPIGFLYALDVLKGLEGKRRILVTPGMIELGDKTYSENRRIAEKAASICDLVIVVSTVNRSAWLDGLQSAGYNSEKIKVFDRRDQALEFFNTIREDGDILLLENDLPDVLEFIEKF